MLSAPLQSAEPFGELIASIANCKVAQTKEVKGMLSLSENELCSSSLRTLLYQLLCQLSPPSAALTGSILLPLAAHRVAMSTLFFEPLHSTGVPLAKQAMIESFKLINFFVV